MARPAIEQLTAAEESSPAAVEIARRFNPAMALPDRDGPWPVAVRYSWSAGADLQSRTIAGDGKVLHAGSAVAGAELDRRRWDELPDHDPAGHRIEYWVDGPGDDRVRDGVTEWRRRWRAASAADRTPTQYAHLFWLDRARGVLVVQYWFFYPFNEWVNHHEGDWEHVNLILQGSGRLAGAADQQDYRMIGCEFYFHGHRIDVTAEWAGHSPHPSGAVTSRRRCLNLGSPATWRREQKNWRQEKGYKNRDLSEIERLHRFDSKSKAASLETRNFFSRFHTFGLMLAAFIMMSAQGFPALEAAHLVHSLRACPPRRVR